MVGEDVQVLQHRPRVDWYELCHILVGSQIGRERRGAYTHFRGSLMVEAR